MATFSLNAWVLVLWTVLLAGVVGGKVLLAGSLRLRFSYLMALAYLAIGLLVFALPSAVPEAVVIESVRQICLWCLPLMLVAVFALATGRVQTADSEVPDLVNSLLLVLLLSVLVLGSRIYLPWCKACLHWPDFWPCWAGYGARISAFLACRACFRVTWHQSACRLRSGYRHWPI
ncbi:MAG: hypothetical protein IPG34_12600 [Rhodocyclaceae bacterium]|nr:hypothetical protein [Rhodocyclaceae bacterium]